MTYFRCRGVPPLQSDQFFILVKKFIKIRLSLVASNLSEENLGSVVLSPQKHTCTLFRVKR